MKLETPQLSLTVRAGEVVALVGAIGAGHRAVLKFLQRFHAASSVVLLDEPPRGIDLAPWRSQGCAIVLASSDLGEVVRLADRVLVMRDGTLAGTLARPDITQAAIMHLAIGHIAAVLVQEAIGEARS